MSARMVRHDAPILARMAPGHLARTGHALEAHLVSDDGGEIWHVVRTCCDTSTVDTSRAVSRVQVWADGFGAWHASVPLSDSRHRDALAARRAIVAAIDERGQRHPDYRVKVTRERVTAHGTAIYGERIYR